MYGIILSVVKSLPTRMKGGLYLIEEVILKNGSILEILRQKDKVLIHNIDNDRMIVTNDAVFGFLKNTTDTNNPLFDFLNAKKKVVRNIFEIDIFSKTIESSIVKKLVLPFILLTNYVSLTVCFFISVFLFKKFVLSNYSSLLSISIGRINILKLIIYYIASMIIITFLHELSHYSYYYSYLSPKRFTFGITIRYISMIMFFTNVPFINTVNAKDKIKIINAGIKMQFVISSVVILLGSITPSLFLSVLFIVNLVTLITNLLPFLKLDGYWAISTFLGVSDYMEEYIKMLKHKAPFKSNIIILGTFNSILILLTVLSLFFEIFKYIISVL